MASMQIPLFVVIFIALFNIEMSMKFYWNEQILTMPEARPEQCLPQTA
jgi:hypothetical protein